MKFNHSIKKIHVYSMCPKTVIETLMDEHFGVHHKGHKPCANKQLSSSSSLYPSSFYPYTSTYFPATTTNVKYVLSLTLVSTSKIWNVPLYRTRPKTMVEPLKVEYFGVHHKGHKPSPTLGRQWNWKDISTHQLLLDFKCKSCKDLNLIGRLPKTVNRT